MHLAFIEPENLTYKENDRVLEGACHIGRGIAEDEVLNE
jgi:hypothetical protein